MKTPIAEGSHRAPEKFRIEIAALGPYLVWGAPPLDQQFIMPNSEGQSWYYQGGERYSTEEQPTCLCRCGASSDKPYCDGSHLSTDWDPTLTASTEPILEEAEEYRGPLVSVADTQKYCAFARFCDAGGQIWNLVGSDDPQEADLVIREANHCPGGRLTARANGTYIEPKLESELSLIEDPVMHCSGPLWVKGGIPISEHEGVHYEIRNRVTLCRCGRSTNKPFCDGKHASSHFHDELPPLPKEQENE